VASPARGKVSRLATRLQKQVVVEFGPLSRPERASLHSMLTSHILRRARRHLMQALRASLKPGIWGVIIGSILTMIVAFSWGGWTTSSTARQQAMMQADTAVTTALVPICLTGKRADVAYAKKLGELTAITSSYEQTEFVMKTGWATFPGQPDPNRAVAEACASALLKTAAAK